MSSENQGGFDRHERPGPDAARLLPEPPANPRQAGPAGATPSRPSAQPNPFLAPPIGPAAPPSGPAAPTAAAGLLREPETPGREPATDGSVLLTPEPGFVAPPSRVFGPQPDRQPAQWSVTLDRFVPPFASVSAAAAGQQRPLMERLVEGAYRWRTALGLTLATLTTMAVVFAWQQTTSERTLVASGRPDAVAGTAVARATSTLPRPEPSPTTPTGQEVGSSVDEVAATTVAAIPPRPSTSPTTRSPGTTADTAPAGPSTSPTTGSTTAPSTTDTSGQTDTSPSTTRPSGTGTSASSTPTSGTSPATPSTTSIPTSAPSTTSPPSSSTTTTTRIAAGVRIEAEGSELLLEARVDNTHAGFSGSGYVTDLVASGRGVRFVVDSPTGGATSIHIRYAAGPAAEPGNRYLSLRVNGETANYRIELVETGSWSTWADLTGEITLLPGRNTITLVKAPMDAGAVNLDYIELR